MTGFRHRGVIEGYYGPPFAHEDRLWLVERIGRWGMNRYVYAPKDDRLHREAWREPYPPQALRAFGELVERGAAAGVDVGFAVAPGLSIAASSRADREALARKLGGFRELGARLACLALDDVPARLVHASDRRTFESLGHAHASLAALARDAAGPEATLYLVPTDYLGVEPTDYLEVLGDALDTGVEVGWTGRTVVSPEIRAAEAARRAAALRRPLLLWDNTPVSDGPMRAMLHLGPYTGRDPGLLEHLSGALLNPMQHARASGVALRTAAAFLADPRGYDAEAAWRAAVFELGQGAAEAFEVFARAHRFSALAPDDRDRELEDALARLRAELAAGRDGAAALAALRALLAPRLGAAERLRADLRDRRLAAELEPWLASHARETRRIGAALDCLATLLGDGPPNARALAVLGMQARLARDPELGAASYGPRRVCYPQLVSMRDEDMRFGPDPALFRDLCLADAFVSLAEQVAAARAGLRRAGA